MKMNQKGEKNESTKNGLCSNISYNCCRNISDRIRSGSLDSIYPGCYDRFRRNYRHLPGISFLESLRTEIKNDIYVFRIRYGFLIYFMDKSLRKEYRLTGVLFKYDFLS